MPIIIDPGQIGWTAPSKDPYIPPAKPGERLPDTPPPAKPLRNPWNIEPKPDGLPKKAWALAIGGLFALALFSTSKKPSKSK